MLFPGGPGGVLLGDCWGPGSERLPSIGTIVSVFRVEGLGMALGACCDRARAVVGAPGREDYRGLSYEELEVYATSDTMVPASCFALFRYGLGVVSA